MPAPVSLPRADTTCLPHELNKNSKSVPETNRKAS
jgi:hypothetical protein